MNGSFFVKYDTCSAIEPINDVKSVDNGVSPVYLFEWEINWIIGRTSTIRDRRIHTE